MQEREYSLYLVRCADGSLYTGIAIDVERRFLEHQCGAGAKYLRGRGPLQLAFHSRVGNRALALRLEHRVKQLDRRAKEALIAGRLGLDELSAATMA